MVACQRGCTRHSALYMPALVAMRWSPDLKARYKHMRAAGKPVKVAIKRKLIQITNTLPLDDRKLEPKVALSRRTLWTYNNQQPKIETGGIITIMKLKIAA